MSNDTRPLWASHDMTDLYPFAATRQDGRIVRGRADPGRPMRYETLDPQRDEPGAAPVALASGSFVSAIEEVRDKYPYKWIKSKWEDL